MAGQPSVAAEQAPTPPARRESWFGRISSAMRDPHYRNFYIGNVMQFGSMNMQLVVRGWLVFHITGSFAALGTMSLANAIPTLIFSPIGGVVADRMPKKTIIQIGQIYNAINAAILAILAAGLFGLQLEFWHLFLSAFLQGVVNSVMQPSRQADEGARLTAWPPRRVSEATRWPPARPRRAPVGRGRGRARTARHRSVRSPRRPAARR